MDASISDEVLQDLPPPILVFLIPNKAVQIEQALHCLWSQQTEIAFRPDVHIFIASFAVNDEVHNFQA